MFTLKNRFPKMLQIVKINLQQILNFYTYANNLKNSLLW